MGKVLNVEEDFLDGILAHVSKALVGKVMKRFEITRDEDTLKRNVKELIYEEFRHLKDLVQAHDKGIGITLFEFKSKGDISTQ